MKTKKLFNYIIGILIYAVIFYVILLPLERYIISISTSLILGIFSGFLNEIITQLRIQNGEKFDKQK